MLSLPRLRATYTARATSLAVGEIVHQRWNKAHATLTRNTNLRIVANSKVWRRPLPFHFRIAGSRACRHEELRGWQVTHMGA